MPRDEVPGVRFAVASALVGALALAGCQSPEEPPSAPSPTPSATSASPSPTATPSPSPSEADGVPAAAREKTEEGAEAFVRHYFEQFNVAWTEPRPTLIASLSDPSCEFCGKTESTAVFLAKEKQKYVNDPVSVVALEPLTGAPEGQMYLACGILQNRSDIVDESGRVIATDPRKEVDFNIALSWTPKGWRMLGVENAS